MPTGRPDWYDQVVLVGSDITVPISIQASSVVIDVNITSAVTLDVNITGSVTLDVNITGSSVTLDVNITGAVTLDVNITGSSVTLDINITSPLSASGNIKTSIEESIQIDVNIAASSVTLNVAITSSSVTLDVNITGSVTLDVNITGSTVALDVNIKSQTVDLDVNIKSQSVTLNVQVQGQASVSIDNASVYLNVHNQNIKMTATGHTSSSPTEYAAIYSATRYFTLFRDMMGLIYRLGIWIRNPTTSDIDITFRLKNSYDAAPLIERTVTVPAGHDGFVYAVTLATDTPRIWWHYDTLILEYQPSADGLEIGKGDWTNFGIGIAGPTGAHSVAVDLLILLEGGGSIPVSGTVNTINIPNRTTKVSFSGTTSAETWVELINEAFIGKIKKIVFRAKLYTKLTGSKVRLTIDDNVIFEDEFLSLAESGIARIKYVIRDGFLVEFNNEFPVNNYAKIECYLEYWFSSNPEIDVAMYYETLR